MRYGWGGVGGSTHLYTCGKRRRGDEEEREGGRGEQLQIKGFLLEWLKMGAAVSAAFGRVAPPPWAPEALSLGRGPYPLLWHFRATDARPEYWLIPLYDGGAWPEQAVLLWEDGCPRVRLDSHPPHRNRACRSSLAPAL